MGRIMVFDESYPLGATWPGRFCRLRSKMTDEKTIRLPEIIDVVAVLSLGPSGSTLLHSLLDNHPDVLSIPFVNGISIYPFWDRWDIDPNPQGNIVDSFINEHAYWFDDKKTGSLEGLNQMGPGMNEVAFAPGEKFRESMNSLLGDARRPSRGLFFAAVYTSYAISIGRTVKHRMVINFSLHNWGSKYANYLLDDFPNVKFIRMVRDPIASIGSTQKFLINAQSPQMTTRNYFRVGLNVILNDNFTGMYFPDKKGASFYNEWPYFPEADNSFRAVRFEDLHTRPEATMKAIARWLDLTWDPCLLETTFDGKLWWNRPASVRITGFDIKQVQKKHSELFTNFDMLRIYALISKRCIKWGYDIPPLSRGLAFRIVNLVLLLLPFRVERSNASAVLELVPDRLKKLSHPSGRNLFMNCFEAVSAALAGFFTRFIPVAYYFTTRAALFSMWMKSMFTSTSYFKLLEPDSQETRNVG